MNMTSKNQYLKTLVSKRGYHLLSRKEKTKLLNEYCKNTGQNRKYVICKIRTGQYLKDKPKGKQRIREKYYDNYVIAALIECWRIFDYACGQRLEPLLKTEVDRLRKFKELKCPDEVTAKLKKMSFSTIDRKLKRQKEIEKVKRKRKQKTNPLLYKKIQIKISSEQDRTKLGNLQIDLVEHCGSSQRGEYICTLSNTDITTGWWEGEAVMGRGQRNTCNGLKNQRTRFPFPWKSIHSDNGGEFINNHLFQYTEKENIEFSRSRPYKKNDNCHVEQKNWTHVKKFVGYHRYDTEQELKILNFLYRDELHFFKNFFQPIMKLKKKTRIGSKIKRQYEKPATPYHRIIRRKNVSKKTKQELQKIYKSLNPAELKRQIDKKLNMLYKAYKNKNNKSKARNLKN